MPAIVVACAELAGLHPTDTELGRLSVVGGGSIYPTVQNLCLALRDQGVGTAFTTLLCIDRAGGPRAAGDPGRLHHRRPHRRRLPGGPFPRKLTRSPVEEIVFAETFDRPYFGGAARCPARR